MRNIKFTKMVASGNDFVVIENLKPKPQAINFNALASEVCDRKFGVGADGLLVIGKSRIADIRMRIFNADGSEAEMCGNGARCVAFYHAKKEATIETMAGIIRAKIERDSVRIKLTDPVGLKLNMPVALDKRKVMLNFINTGVPHAIIFVDGLERIDVAGIGRVVRYHKIFSLKGTNVDFVEVLDGNKIAIRTYERGVEDETLACGTGSVASALIFAIKSGSGKNIQVLTKSREVLTVYFDRRGNKFSNVWLQGKARIVFQGHTVG